LKRQLDLRPVRNTSIIEIRVQDEDPAEAAEIANAIARVYADYRAGKQENGSGKGVGSLVTQMKEQDALAAQAQAKVDALRKQLNLSEASSTDSSPSQLLSAETLRRMETLRLESQAEYVRSRALLEALRKLSLEDLIQAIPTTGIQDATLNELVAQRNLVEQRLVATEKEFGPQYSEVVKLKAQAEDLRQKVKYRAEGILRGLDARVSSLRQGLDDLDQKVAKSLRSEQQTAAASRPYLDAQRELEELQRFRQMLALKIAAEKTDLQLPRNSLVEIVDPAHASTRPSSPNRPRAVGLMASGLVLSLLGLLLARSGRNQAMALASS
jgi:polysaccharide biosynthesis transport protein